MEEEKRPFIKKNVGKKTTGNVLKRILWIVGGAIVFGLVAVVVFVLARPAAERYLAKPEETEATQQTVSIPRDDVPETTAPVIRETKAPSEEVEIYEDDREGDTEQPEEKNSLKETETESAGDSLPDKTDPETVTVSETDCEPESSEAVEEIVHNAMQDYSYSVGDLTSMWSHVAALCDSLDSSVVTIKSVTNGLDLFENELSTEGTYSGIVVARTLQQALILTVEDAVKSADSLKVVWNNGFEQKGYIRAVDKYKGLAVVSVNNADMSQATSKIAVPVELGNSYRVARGDMLIELGSPNGIPHSANYTWTSYVAKDVNIVDGSTRLFYTENDCNYTLGTWVLNTEGELIGWATGKYEGSEGSGTKVVEGLSDYKKVLERLMNSGKYAYFGITPVNVSESMRSSGVPEGVFAGAVEPDSPAYEAGIQPGDVIVSMDDNKVMTVMDYEKMLERFVVGKEMKVELLRSGREEYVPIEYDVTLAGR